MYAGSELGVLKWRFQSKDESLVPLSINCWPSASGSESYVNIEYESGVDYDLQNVVIAIPLPHMSHAPAVNQVGPREWFVRRLHMVSSSRVLAMDRVFAECSLSYPATSYVP